MRWISFEAKGKESFGLVVGDQIVDASKRHTDYQSLKDVLIAGKLGEVGRRLIGEAPDLRLNEVAYLPVITHPEKILCAGLNYKTHQEESGREATPHPTIFTRFAASQMGHGQPMIRPVESTRFDFEGEIALIIGRAGRRIKAAEALEYVAGYSCYNDGSVRDWQFHTTQFTPGKNFSGTGGFGPWMMTPEEIGDPDRMEITTRLNGEVMQHAMADQMIHSFAQLIEYCSTFTDLVPGDVIVTGTPGGVGVARKPPVFMKEGDVVEVEVKPIGILRHEVVVG